MTRFGETTRKPLINKSALVQFSHGVTGPGILRSTEMGITSAGLQTGNAGCGNQIRARTAALNVRKTMVHYLVSPPRPPLLKRTTSQS
ncbi:TPA: hypothetical protein QCG56_004050 [Enterobacter cancerogenus]|nr:hypothetical protein [Enterobacter cancerogenus]HDR2167144.1 hypothetical protein [Enterobacter cancerogenus]HDR2269726.1 hypothetical protein [Enterobacter cancerogenus]